MDKCKTKQLALKYQAMVCFFVGPPKSRILNILARSSYCKHWSSFWQWGVLYLQKSKYLFILLLSAVLKLERSISENSGFFLMRLRRVISCCSPFLPRWSSLKMNNGSFNIFTKTESLHAQSFKSIYTNCQKPSLRNPMFTGWMELIFPCCWTIRAILTRSLFAAF